MSKPIDYNPAGPLPRDPNRQRHDIPWSQPPPLYPPTLADDPLPVKPASEPVCKHCNDTHVVDAGDRGRQNCTHCPTPCEACRKDRIGAYCGATPCACACHRRGKKPEPPASEPSAYDLTRRALSVMLDRAEWYRIEVTLCADPDGLSQTTRDWLSRTACDLYRYGLERGRAAHAAEVERLTASVKHAKETLSTTLQIEAEQDRELEQLRAERDKYCGELGRLTVAHAVEVERLRGELEKERELSNANLIEMYDRAPKAERQLAEARARPVPSDEALAAGEEADCVEGVPQEVAEAGDDVLEVAVSLKRA